MHAHIVLHWRSVIHNLIPSKGYNKVGLYTRMSVVHNIGRLAMAQSKQVLADSYNIIKSYHYNNIIIIIINYSNSYNSSSFRVILATK